MSTMRPLPLALSAACVLLAAGPGISRAAAEPKPGGDAVTVAPRPLKLRTTMSGRIGADLDELQFRFKAYAGRMAIQTVVPSGGEAKQGDVLLALDPAPGDEAVRDAGLAAEAARIAAEAARQELAALDVQQRTELEKAAVRARRADEDQRLYLEQRWPLERKAHELNVRRLEASIADQEKELEELEKMYKASELAADTKEIVIQRARRDLEITRETLVQSRSQHRLTLEVDHPRRQVDFAHEAAWSAEDLEQTRKRQALAAARAKNALAQAEQALAKARDAEAKLREDCRGFRLVAPRDGVVVHGSAAARLNGGKGTAPGEGETMKAGDAVQAHQVLLTVIPAGPPRVQFRIPEAQRQAVRKGTPAEVRLWAFPGRAFRGAVTEAAELPDGAEGSEKSYSASAALEGAEPAVRPGLTAWIELDLGEVPDALAIPVEAVLVKAGRSFCRVRDGGGVEEREIQVGRGNGIEVQVVSGLKAGDVVVVKP